MPAHDPSGRLDQRFPRDGWKTSTWSGPNGGDCVEVNLQVPGVVGLRDSKCPGGGVLSFGTREWRVFLAAVRNGRLRR